MGSPSEASLLRVLQTKSAELMQRAKENRNPFLYTVFEKRHR